MSTHRPSTLGRAGSIRNAHRRPQAGSWALSLDREFSTRTTAELRDEISSILSRAVLRMLLPAIGFPEANAPEGGNPACRGSTASLDESDSAQGRSVAVNTLDSRANRLEPAAPLEASCPAYVTTEASP